MATINTIDDLLRIVRENEEYRVALRRELLTDDLLSLPAQFAEMLETPKQDTRRTGTIPPDSERDAGNPEPYLERPR